MRCDFGSPFEDTIQQSFERYLTTFPDIEQTVTETGYEYAVRSSRGGLSPVFAAIRVRDTDSDCQSGLNRPQTFRVDFHADAQTFQAQFGSSVPRAAGAQVAALSGDGKLTPHPNMAERGWVSVVNPTERWQRALKPMLDRAYTSARQTAGLNTA